MYRLVRDVGLDPISDGLDIHSLGSKMVAASTVKSMLSFEKLDQVTVAGLTVPGAVQMVCPPFETTSDPVSLQGRSADKKARPFSPGTQTTLSPTVANPPGTSLSNTA